MLAAAAPMPLCLPSAATRSHRVWLPERTGVSGGGASIRGAWWTCTMHAQSTGCNDRMRMHACMLTRVLLYGATEGGGALCAACRCTHGLGTSTCRQ